MIKLPNFDIPSWYSVYAVVIGMPTPPPPEPKAE